MKKHFTSIWSRKPSELGLTGLLLFILSLIYGALVRIRLLMYGFGIFKSKKVEGATVISVGNITVGGTGKTPVTILISHLLKEMGQKPAVVSRGYGRRSRERVQVVSNGSDILVNYPDAADEAVLCAQKLDGVPVLSALKRASGIRAAYKLFDASVVVLDDGYSNLSTWKDRNILLVDATDPFGNGHVLPAGPLREPLSSAVRADAVMITRAGNVSPHRIRDIKERLQKVTWRSVPFFLCDIVPQRIIEPGGARHPASEFLAGRNVCMLSGIASPAQFEEMVRALTASPVEHFIFEDHHQFTVDELEHVIDALTSDSILLTTEKDFVRLRSLAKVVAHRLTIGARIHESDLDAFKSFLLT